VAYLIRYYDHANNELRTVDVTTTDRGRAFEAFDRLDAANAPEGAASVELAEGNRSMHRKPVVRADEAPDARAELEAQRAKPEPPGSTDEVVAERPAPAKKRGGR